MNKNQHFEPFFALFAFSRLLKYLILGYWYHPLPKILWYIRCRRDSRLSYYRIQ